MIANFKPIPTYVINLKKREDRRAHILKQFEGRKEFSINIVEAVEHPRGAIGLWMTLVEILRSVAGLHDYILLCEDDHQFTETYSPERLFDCIAQAKARGGELLCGGVSWLSSALPATKDLFWVEKFSGLQFTIIFRSFYQTILNAGLEQGEAADYKLSSLTDRKFFVYPFLSVQQDFGYSDVTSINNTKGHVHELFVRSCKCIEIIKTVVDFYDRTTVEPPQADELYEAVTFPTFVINQHADKHHVFSILKRFEGKREFELQIINPINDPDPEKSKWLALQEIINEAVNSKEDMIVLCDYGIEFTAHYSPRSLIKNIIEANEQAADYLLGGVANFTYAVPTSQNRFWVEPCHSASLLVIYRQMFTKIIAASYTSGKKVDELLSEIASNKLVVYPFIATTKNLLSNVAGDKANRSFAAYNINAEERLQRIRTANQYLQTINMSGRSLNILHDKTQEAFANGITNL